MPQLPQYDTPQVKPAGIPGPVARPDAPLAAFGGGERMEQAQNAVEGVADQAADLALKKAERGRQMAVDSEVYGAAAQLSSMQTGLMNDAKSQLGRNAFGIYNPTMDSFRQQAAQIGSQLQTPEAKQMYQKLVFEHQVQLDHGLQDHIATQRQEDTKGTIAAASEQFENAAMSTATSDPRATSFNLRMAQAADRDLAKNAGLSPVAAQAFIDQRQSARQLKVLTMYTSAGQDLAAAQYFKDNRDNFKGKDLERAQELTIEGSARGQAQRNADAIFAGKFSIDQDGVATMTEGAKTLGEAEAAARAASTDPKVRAYTVEEVGRRWTQMQQDLEQQRQVRLSNITKGLLQNGGDLNAVIAQDPIGWNSLTGQQQEEATKMSRTVQERRDPRTDADTFYDLLKMARNPATEAEFAKVNLQDPYYFNTLSKDSRDKLMEVQGSIISKTSATSALLSFHNEIADAIDKGPYLYGRTNALEGDEKTRMGQLEHQLDLDYSAKKLALGNTRELTDQERKDLINYRLNETRTVQAWVGDPGHKWELFSPSTWADSSNYGNRKIPAAMILRDDKVVTKEGTLWNDTVKGMELKPTENPNIPKGAPPIPSQIDRVRWAKLIKDSGGTVTEEKMRRIQQLYRPGMDQATKARIMKIAEE